MFSDPYPITIDGTAYSLVRTGSGLDSSRYATAARDLRMSITHNYGKRVRRVIRLDRDTLVSNPLVSGQNISQSMGVYLVVNTPVGYDTSAAKKTIDGYLAALTASSGAAVSKLLGGES